MTDDEACCIEARPDWARGVRGLLIWGLPAALVLASPLFGERYLVVVCPAALTFMGAACLLNARRCGRIHCYLTGPFFLLLGGLSLLHGLGVLSLGIHGWSILSAALIIGGGVLAYLPECLLGQYRTRSMRENTDTRPVGESHH